MLCFFAVAASWGAEAGQDSAGLEPVAAPAAALTDATGGEAPSGPEADAAPDTAERTELNLLGEVDTEGGESRRNENVQLTLVDNNVQKEINIRMGTTATIVREFDAAQSYFGTEFGNSPRRPIHLAPLGRRDMHGSFYESHGNSVFSARSFFQVGAVKPAHRNDYGLQFLMPLPAQSSLSVNLSQQRDRGNVNGNVLIPLLEEREPLAVDPALRDRVRRIMDSYPAESPNRPDINPRSHNTNAPQRIDNDIAGGHFDLPLGDSQRLVANYRFRKQAVDAFQLVKGQNPNTTTGSHDGRLSWNRAWSAATSSDVSARFRRMTTLIVQDETALGPLIFMGRQIQSLGGTSSIPYDRVQNFYSYAATVASSRGNHSFKAGVSTVREQLNGIESSGHAGLILFTSNFGRDMITNLRRGEPSRISKAFGAPHRGFRRWRSELFLGDTWAARRNLTLSFGLRYEPTTRPVEVNSLSELPFGCDCNNFAPRFGFAYRTGVGVLRGAYASHYGEIFTATYTQERFNPPGNVRISVVAPDLLDPFGGVTPDSVDPNARSSVIRIDPELVAPYSHHYNFSWVVSAPGGVFAEMGYVGTRSHRLLSGWVLNRAREVEGIARTTGTVNQRRPDQRYFDVRHILNGSRAYFDAAKATLGVRDWKGVTLDFSYWLSKAIDLGAHYEHARRVRRPKPDRVRCPSRCQVPQRLRPASRGTEPDRLPDAAGRRGEQPVEQSLRRVGAELDPAVQDWHAVHHVHRVGRPGLRQCRWRDGRPSAPAGSDDPGPSDRPSRHIQADASANRLRIRAGGRPEREPWPQRVSQGRHPEHQPRDLEELEDCQREHALFSGRVDQPVQYPAVLLPRERAHRRKLRADHQHAQ